jgi:tetratricopeptide (TPR) repeat protein
MELYEPLPLGPLTVSALSLTLPGLRFPLDLSGGVPTFRHRRGELEHARLEASADTLGRWLTPRLGQLLGELVRPVSVWAQPGAVGVGMVAGDRALAFDLLWAPLEGDARFVVCNARGVGLAGPALGYALRAVDCATNTLAQRRGRIVQIERAAALLGRRVLPAVGARAPSARRTRFGELRADGDLLAVELDASFLPPVLEDDAVRALEVAQLAVDADQALACGEMEPARAGYLVALEQAPRHPELARLVAEIDLATGGRDEAALAILVESMQAVRAGWIGAELLARVGDLEGARRAVADAARVERYAPLAALLWTKLAEFEAHPRDQLRALDHAVACSPALACSRWARLCARARLGQIEAALADAEHLEAAATGARARHEVCRRAASELLSLGFVRDAGRLFERALRYLPDDAASLAGLGRSLAAAGRSDRAFCLFQRAIVLSERQGRADPGALLDLAKLLAEQLVDLPQAIARVRQVPASADQALEARALEACWRARLGDVVGASLAYGRLREAVELDSRASRDSASWLLEAARFEQTLRDDPAAAERHLSVALRVAPRDRTVGDAYRKAAASVAAAVRQSAGAAPAAAKQPIAGNGLPDAASSTCGEATHGPEQRGGGTLAEDESAAQRLATAVLSDSGRAQIVLELVDMLARLGRGRELVTLLSTVLEDASRPERSLILPRARAVLGRLIESARRAGREADLAVLEAAFERLC